MITAAVPATARCSCGRSWDVAPRADGTFPKTARCAARRGGCGRTGLKVTAAVTVAGAWDPPSEPRGQRDAAGRCPDCGGPVLAEPRGITLWCPACPVLVTPPGVLAPYERGAGSVREARSQRERDDDAKKAVLLAGEFLRRVRALLDDPKIHPASADLLAWYEEEIAKARTARDGRRLAGLADQFADDQAGRAFRRRHRWQGEPAIATAGHPDDDDEDDQEGEDTARAVTAGAVVLALPAAAAQPQPAQPQEATWGDALAARGWQLAERDDSGACQIIERAGRCPWPIGGHPPVFDGFTSGWTCSDHWNALGSAISAINRNRGITT